MATTDNGNGDESELEDRLMLHFGGDGPVELEVWHEDCEEATHLITKYPSGKKSLDITDELRRAGYELVELEGNSQ